MPPPQINHGVSHSRKEFLKDVQKSLINTKKNCFQCLLIILKTQYVANLTKGEKSIKNRNMALFKSEEHCQEVQLDTSKAKKMMQIKRYSDAIDKKK